MNVFTECFDKYTVTYCDAQVFVTVPRYAKHYMEDKILKRTLLKVFGIRIDIIVQSLVSHSHFHHVQKGVWIIGMLSLTGKEV